MRRDETAKVPAAGAGSSAAVAPAVAEGPAKQAASDLRTVLFWAFVGLPLAWGVWVTLSSAVRIF